MSPPSRRPTRPPNGPAWPAQELLAALGRGAASPTLLLEAVEGGGLPLRWWNEAAESSGLVQRPTSRSARAQPTLLPALVESLWDAARACVELGSAHRFEEFLTIDGEETWWMTTLTPIGTPSAPSALLVATYVDLGFLRPTELALQRTEANFRVLIERSPDAIFICRPDGTTIFENPAATRMLGEEGVSGGERNVFEYAHEAGRADLESAVARAFRGDAVTQATELALRGAAGTLYVSFSVMRMPFDGADVVVLEGRDLTELHRTQASFASADSLIALGRMAAGIAHEINNPLGYLSSNLAYALDQLALLRPDVSAGVGEELDEVRSALSDAAEGVRRVADIVRDLRGLARDDSEAPTPTSAEGALEAALKLARAELQRHARVEKRYEPVPMVHAREPRLVQVFLNLLLNATHAIATARKDAEPPRSLGVVTLSVRRWNDELIAVEVQDDGCGIAPANRERMFAPFFSTKPSGAGMGLGLTVCHQLVSAMGGRIDVESELGRGSTFRVLLRATTPDAGSIR